MTLGRRTVSLPPTLAPRGLSREEAAAYLGIGTTLFDELVKAGTLPAARRLRRAVRWDRHELDFAFENLPTSGHDPHIGQDDDPWGRVRA